MPDTYRLPNNDFDFEAKIGRVRHFSEIKQRLRDNAKQFKPYGGRYYPQFTRKFNRAALYIYYNLPPVVSKTGRLLPRAIADKIAVKAILSYFEHRDLRAAMRDALTPFDMEILNTVLDAKMAYPWDYPYSKKVQNRTLHQDVIGPQARVHNLIAIADMGEDLTTSPLIRLRAIEYVIWLLDGRLPILYVRDVLRELWCATAGRDGGRHNILCNNYAIMLMAMAYRDAKSFEDFPADDFADLLEVVKCHSLPVGQAVL